MKKIVFLAAALCLLACYAYGQETDTVTLKGTIIDNTCLNANKEDIAGFIKTHPKSCALKPDCVASGYSIFADGKAYRFDTASSAKVEEFLKKDDSTLEVTVTAKKVGEELSLLAIQNQQ